MMTSLFSGSMIPYCFAVVGLIIVLLGVARSFFANTTPFDITGGKEGVSVKTDFAGAGLLAGMTILLGAGYFIYQDYDKKIAELQSKANDLADIKKMLGTIDLSARLEFPFNATSIEEVQIVVQRQGQFERMKLRADPGINPVERVVVIKNLRVGDIVTVVASYASAPNAPLTIYQSREIEIPSSRIKMAVTP